MSGLATRLYRGEANFNIVGRRKMWFQVFAGLAIAAILALVFLRFNASIEFKGGNEFQVPVSAGSLSDVEQVVDEAVHRAKPDAGEILTGQQIGGTNPVYSIRTPSLDEAQTNQVKAEISEKLGGVAVSDSRVSASWGGQITQQALISLLVFLAAVTTYLSFRFEWRMAVAALASLLFNLLLTAGVYAASGFEVTPNTVIGFLTILGFALYDVVVVFDKVQENTRGITGKANETYAEATNLALNQTFMRSINTSLVALLPVGGLLFIGAGLLGAGTLKDLGLVLFIGMGLAVFSSLFFATPLLAWMKEMDPVIQNHTKRVLARRASLKARAEAGDAPERKEVVAAGAPAAAPKAGAKPVRQNRPSKSGGKRR